MAQYLDKAGLTTLWTKIKYTFALKSHTHKKSEITDLTIPTVNNPTITINQGGVKKGSFSLNQSGAATIDLTDDNTTYSTATQSSDGLMSASDKKKLEGIAEGANKITVDSSLSSTSTNPVQNKVIKGALDGKAASSHTHPIDKISGLQDALDGKQAKGDYYTINGVQARDDEFVRGDGNGGLVASGYTTSSFASSNHDHDSRYYTESEIDDKLGKKANISHSHSSLTNSSGRVFNVPTGGSGGEQKTLVITDDLNAYQPAGNYANAKHDHTISDITGLYDELTGMTYVADSSDNSVQLETYGDGNSFSIPTKGYVDNALNGKSDSNHNHDSRYYTESEIDSKLNNYVTGTTFINYTTYIEGEVNKKANASHDHGISDINGLQSALDGKSNTGHGHTISNITNLQSTIESIYSDMGLQDEAIAGKADSVHEHQISNINGLQSALDGKSGTGHTHTSLNTAFVFNNSDMPQGSDNLSKSTTAHKINFYSNGLSIPYQMDNSNDGGILRCRGNSESNVIFELGTWDDSGAGETIQFNYYPTTSQVTPTYSVSVPKKTGTIALTSDIPTSLPANGGTSTYATYIGASGDAYSKSDIVPKNHNSRFYPFIGSAYRNANYKITLPISGRTSSSHEWMMITMELILGGSYSNGANGTIFLSYYFRKDTSNNWYADDVRAIGIGNKLADNSVRIQYDISNPGIFYVHSNNSTYNSFSIQNLTANDTAPNFDFTKTTIEPVDSIPSGLSSVPLTCLDSKGDNKLYVNNTAVSLDGHTHSSVADISNSNATTFAYSKSGLNYNDYTWLAGWNGYELRAVNKSQFATSGHTHSYLPLSGGTLTGALNFNNSTWNTVGDDVYIGDYDQAGSLGVKGKNGQTNIGFVNQSNNYYIKLASPGVTENRTITMPNDSGTMALTKNIPTSLPASNISMSSDGTTLTITYS